MSERASDERMDGCTMHMKADRWMLHEQMGIGRADWCNRGAGGWMLDGRERVDGCWVGDQWTDG